MPSVPFHTVPDPARLWIFASAQPVLGGEAEWLLERVELFIRGWTAHGEPVVGACDWLHDHFLLVAADEEATGVSGCSIDSLFRTLKAAQAELGVELLDSSPIWFRDPDGSVSCASRPDFRELVVRGEVEDASIVFDNTIGTVEALRSGEWERPFRGSWHARAFAPRRGIG